MMVEPRAVCELTPLRFNSVSRHIERSVPTEEAVAIVCNGTSVAVMMATPADLEDFALGFCFSEGIVDAASDVESLDIISHDTGTELRLWIKEDLAERLLARRRRMAGPTGCGLCGIESLDEAARAVRSVRDVDVTVSGDALKMAMAQLRDEQHLNAVTRAVHAAAAWSPLGEYGAVREDVGRHNALDKLIGATLGEQQAEKVLLLTSRLSIELIQKAAMAGFSIVAAISVPTALAVRAAERSGMTLVAVAREDGFEIFTHPSRIKLPH